MIGGRNFAIIEQSTSSRAYDDEKGAEEKGAGYISKKGPDTLLSHLAE